MVHSRWLAAASMVLALSPRVAGGEGPSPVEGLWQVVDDRSGHENGVVRLRVIHEGLVGTVERLRAGSAPDARCSKCPPPQKDSPVLGLTVVWGLTRHGDVWDGGTILDPDSGSTYRCSIKLGAHGQLEVRGYVGISLFGRTQFWSRIQ
jgi:uncharacterized protein (DUF2147 family)